VEKKFPRQGLRGRGCRAMAVPAAGAGPRRTLSVVMGWEEEVGVWPSFWPLSHFTILESIWCCVLLHKICRSQKEKAVGICWGSWKRGNASTPVCFSQLFVSLADPVLQRGWGRTGEGGRKNLPVSLLRSKMLDPGRQVSESDVSHFSRDCKAQQAEKWGLTWQTLVFFFPCIVFIVATERFRVWICVRAFVAVWDTLLSCKSSLSWPCCWRTLAAPSPQRHQEKGGTGSRRSSSASTLTLLTGEACVRHAAAGVRRNPKVVSYRDALPQRGEEEAKGPKWQMPSDKFMMVRRFTVHSWPTALY